MISFAELIFREETIMAQTRTHKIGTIYSRVRNLLEQGAMRPELKPVWYDIYEAFPPKYEPRFDRHLITFGNGCNVKNLPPAPQVLYEEDEIRAKYYKVFNPTDEQVAKSVASSEVINLLDNSDVGRRTLSQIFIEKYKQIKAEGKISEDELFTATITALEVDGINLLQSPSDQWKSEQDKVNITNIEFPSINELLSSDSNENKKE